MTHRLTMNLPEGSQYKDDFFRKLIQIDRLCYEYDTQTRKGVLTIKVNGQNYPALERKESNMYVTLEKKDFNTFEMKSYLDNRHLANICTVIMKEFSEKMAGEGIQDKIVYEFVNILATNKDQ